MTSGWKFGPTYPDWATLDLDWAMIAPDSCYRSWPPYNLAVAKISRSGSRQFSRCCSNHAKLRLHFFSEMPLQSRTVDDLRHDDGHHVPDHDTGPRGPGAVPEHQGPPQKVQKTWVNQHQVWCSFVSRMETFLQAIGWISRNMPTRGLWVIQQTKLANTGGVCFAIISR